MSNFKPPQAFDYDNPKWNEWSKTFEIYRKITKLDKKPEEIKIMTLQFCKDIQCEETVKTMNLTNE